VENIKKINIIDSLNKLHTNLNCLKNNIIYLTIHGSLAYGTATPESDLDIRGIFIPPKKYFLGALDRCEQAEFKEPHDIVIFELRKFVHLALDNNPNVIELLFTDPSDHLLTTTYIDKLFNIKEKFLSKKARFTFSGYAISQLKRINLHRRWLLNPPKKKPERKDFDLPENVSLIPQHQLLEIESAIHKKIGEWQLDTTGLPNDLAIAFKNKMQEILEEIKIHLFWVASPSSRNSLQ